MDREEALAETRASSQQLDSGTADTMASGDVASAATMASEPAGPLPSSPDTLPEVADELYVRLDEFARGGLGRIVRARDQRTGRIVAIKEMLAESPDAATRFVREAIVTANLQHPAIVPVYEVGRWRSGQPFYAMKLVRGRPLNVVIEGCADLDARLALVPHVIAIADALAYAHGERVIHRDLKPHNVLVGAHGETVVIDWGLARRLDDAEQSLPPAVIAAASDATVVGAVLGTPSYMAPEQARGERVDERADVYAIGALFYNTLSGKAPYSGKTVEEVIGRVKTVAPRRLRDVVPAIPPDLAAIVERAMARAPEDRYPSAAELAADLRRFANGQLVAAYHYTRTQRLRRFVRRHRAPLAISAIAVTTLATFGTVSIRDVLASREEAREQRRAAIAARDEATSKREEATEHLRTAYLDRARVELAAGHADRSLPLVVAAGELGAGDASTRFMAARALDMLPSIRRHAGAFVGAVHVPGSSDLLLCGAGGIERWSPATDRVVWHTDGDTGDIAIAGTDLVAGARPDGLVLVSLDDGHLVAHLAPPAGWTVLGLLGSDPSHRWMGVLTKDQRVAVWDSTTRALVASPQIAHVDNAPLVSPDGQHLMAAADPDGWSKYYALYDMHGRELLRMCPRCKAVAATRDAIVAVGRASTTTPSTIRIADWNGRVLADIPTATTSDVQAVALTPQVVAIVATDGSLEVFDRATGAMRWRTILPDQGYDLRIDGVGRLWVLGLFEGVFAFDLATAVPLAHMPSGTGDWIGLSDDGNSLATVVALSEARSWSVGHLLRRPIAPTPARTRLLAFGGDGSLFASSDDGTLTKYDRDGTELYRFAAHTKRMAGLQIVDDSTVLTAGADNVAVLWDASTHKELRRFAEGHHAEASPDGRTVATSGDDGTVALWDRAGASKLRVLGKLGKPVMRIHWSRDSRIVAAIDEDGMTVAWEASTGREVRSLAAVGDGVDLAISPDARWLVRGVAHPPCGLFSLRGEPDRPLADLADKQVFGAAFSSDGALLALAGSGYVGVWDVATGKARMVAQTDTASIAVAFSPDGLLYSVGLDHALRVWDIASGGELWRVATPQEAYALAVSADGGRVAVGTLTAGLVVELPGAAEPAALRRAVQCRTGWHLDDAGRLVRHSIDAAACNSEP